MYDVIIIGAGIVGTTIARKLSRYKLDLLILEKEKDVSMGVSKANSAIVHGGYAEPHEELRGRICYKGRIQYEQLDKELNFGFDPIGSLVLCFDEDNLDGLKELKKQGEENGLDDMKILDHDEIMEIEPNVNPDVKYALYCEGAGVCSPYEMVIAMAENAIHNGAELKLEEEVVDIEKNGHFTVKTANNNQYESKIVINCAGLHSKEVNDMINEPYFDQHPRSGEYILMRKGAGDRINQVLFQMPTDMGKGILVTPTYHNNLMIGPDALDDEEIDRDTHIERLEEIYEQAQLTTDTLNIREFIRSFSGSRPVASTGDFIIENTETDGFINCAGIQSPGLTSSPAIADMVIDIIKDLDVLEFEEDENFDPYREPIIERKKLRPLTEIKDDLDLEPGNPERLVCRCEQVREKTIVDAMNREIPVTTVDGVKRRTRATMGFCQGEFCRPRVVEVMERQLGREVEGKYDIEHSGISRVGKKDIMKYLKEEKEREQKENNKE